MRETAALPRFVSYTTGDPMPRLPLAGSIDLTYRCHFNCRHCWLRIPANAAERKDELAFDEIRGIVEQARALGCREWYISGGEPMLRPDFEEVFDYITRRSAAYSLNTNGSLITPAIAQLMTRKGAKMVSLYGATPEVCDHVTRLPGSFEQTMRGLAYLREAKAGFIVQIVPMRDNYHQLRDMIRFAESQSPVWRIGADWLNLAASGDDERNAEILKQRLDPATVIDLAPPALGYEDWLQTRQGVCAPAGDDHLLAQCAKTRNEFHVDPYGGMSLCSHVKDPALRYDLRRGTFEEAWERFIPSLGDQVCGGQEFREHCGSCALRADCRWCAVYGHLEHRRFSAPVTYLCEIAQLAHAFKEDRRTNYRRYFHIAGMTVQVESDLPIEDHTFAAKFEGFRAEGPGDDNIIVRHHFTMPRLDESDLGEQVYSKPPWAIYKKDGAWIYVGLSPDGSSSRPHRVMVFNSEHTHGEIYNNGAAAYLSGEQPALTMLPSDHIMLARVLADRSGCCFHSSGAIVEGAGMLFVGHSEAGKTTIAKQLIADGRAHILCDERNIVRRWSDGWHVHGTWSHGEMPVVSGEQARLGAIFFLEKSSQNRLVQLRDHMDVLQRLLGCVIRPLTTADWWDKTLVVLERLVHEVPCYEMQFDTTGVIVAQLHDLARAHHTPTR